MHSLFAHRQPFDFQLLSVYSRIAEVGHYEYGQRINYEMVYKFDGRSQQYFHDLTVDMVPDCIYLAPKYSINSCTVTERGSIINILFDIPEPFPNKDILPEVIPLTPNNRYKSQFIAVRQIWENKSPASYHRCHAMVSSILADLIAEREKQYLQSGKYQQIAPAVDYIRQNYRMAISVSDLTELCGISDEYLRRLFRSYLGQTPLEYIHTLRLSHARELLLNGMSVTDAAAESGFENPNYFSRLYKKHYKISPSRADRIIFTDPYGKEPTP